MNPLTNTRNITKLNERELELGVPESSSWHQMYKNSSWIFVGNLDYELTEGDVICVFSQFGEVNNIHLVRDKTTGKSKGFGFVCYDDQRSTILAVDNLNAIKLCGKTIRVDHCENYKIPKHSNAIDPEQLKYLQEGCAPKPVRLVKQEQKFAEEANLAKIKEEEDRSRTDRKKASKDGRKREEKKKEANRMEFDETDDPVEQQRDDFRREEPKRDEFRRNDRDENQPRSGDKRADRRGEFRRDRDEFRKDRNDHRDHRNERRREGESRREEESQRNEEHRHEHKRNDERRDDFRSRRDEDRKREEKRRDDRRR